MEEKLLSTRIFCLEYSDESDLEQRGISDNSGKDSPRSTRFFEMPSYVNIAREFVAASRKYELSVFSRDQGQHALSLLIGRTIPGGGMRYDGIVYNDN